MLEALSIDHARELNVLGPQLIRTLSALKTVHSGPRRPVSERESEI